MNEYEEAIEFFFKDVLWLTYKSSKTGELKYNSLDNFDSVEGLFDEIAVISRRGEYSQMIVGREHIKSTLEQMIENGIHNEERVKELMKY